MPRFSANLSLLFTEFELEDRFAEAAGCGFDTVEIQFPYTLTPSQLITRLDDNGLALDLFNLPAGDWAGGDRGIACQPERIAEFRAGVEQALVYAEATGCRKLNCLAGLPTGDRATALAVMADNLAYAADQLAAEGITLCIEAINTRDVPGFLIHRTGQGLCLLDQVGADNVGLQYDVYHMQIMEGDLIPTLQSNIDRIAHIQIADTPGRHEPGTGEINFPYLFSALDRMGYTGRVGLEYVPLTTTHAGLSWMTEPLRLFDQNND